MPTSIQFTITFNDYLNAQRLHSKSRWWKRLVQIANRMVLPAFGVLLVIGGVAIARDGESSKSFLLVIGCGLFLLSYPLLARLYLGYCYRVTRAGTGECEFDFNSDSIQTRTTNTKGEVQWPAIRSFSEDKKSFLLYIAPAKFFVIPKRVCSEDQINELRSLFQTQVIAKAR
jgi:hypothetical protein